MLANSAATLPRGHYLIETYLFDINAGGSFDQRGQRLGSPHSHLYGTLTYALLGVTDRVSLGLVPVTGYAREADGGRSAGLRPGDLAGMLQFKMMSENRCNAQPTVSINVQETLPTGKYDDLGDRTADGMGSGAYTTTVSLFGQKSYWLPNGRILRMRLDVSQAVSRSVALTGASVYGTPETFRGHAEPGATTFVDASWEYSATRRWVAALDATYRHARTTRVVGNPAGAPTSATATAPGDAFGLAPALEYSWTANLGVLVGTRVIVAGRNASATVTPAIAINYVH
ncbi:MAG: transporter [bacterium]